MKSCMFELEKMKSRLCWMAVISSLHTKLEMSFFYKQKKTRIGRISHYLIGV